MSCLVHFVAACLFDPSSLYIKADLETAITDSHQTIGQWGEGEWCRTRWCSGPIASLRVGLSAELGNGLTLDYGLMHRSRVNTDTDRGYESVFASLTWKPFK